jgi:trigger factor
MPDTDDLRIEVSEPATWSRRLSITVSRERVRRVRQSVASGIANRVRLPGFRKGKTPASILERQFGPMIEQETVDRVIQDAYRDALASRDFRPLAQGRVENVTYPGGDSDLTFEVQLEVQPELQLRRLEGFHVVRPSEAVAEAEVDTLLERLRGERAALHPLEEGGKPAYGDLVLVEITELDAEVPGEPRQFRFELGEQQAIPDIEAAIMTLSAGEEGEFAVTYPEDFPDATQRGVEQRLRIRLVEARKKVLAELDDGFARELGDFDSLVALRDRVRSDLEAEARRRADQAVRDRLVQAILEANPFEVPPSMVERFLDYQTGDAPDAKAKRKPRSDEEQERLAQLRELMRPGAEASLRRMLLVERVAEHEGLEPTADDVDARVEAMAAEHGRSPSEVWVELERSGQLQGLEAEIREEKVFAHLIGRNTVTQD